MYTINKLNTSLNGASINNFASQASEIFNTKFIFKNLMIRN